MPANVTKSMRMVGHDAQILKMILGRERPAVPFAHEGLLAATVSQAQAETK
jgi:hypothetical protein